MSKWDLYAGQNIRSFHLEHIVYFLYENRFIASAVNFAGAYLLDLSLPSVDVADNVV